MPYLVRIGNWVPFLGAVVVSAGLLYWAPRSTTSGSVKRALMACAIAAVAMAVLGQFSLRMQLDADNLAAHQHNGLDVEERLRPLGSGKTHLRSFSWYALATAMPFSRGEALHRIEMALEKHASRGTLDKLGIAQFTELLTQRYGCLRAYDYWVGRGECDTAKELRATCTAARLPTSDSSTNDERGGVTGGIWQSKCPDLER